jgi:hypothetical protein
LSDEQSFVMMKASELERIVESAVRRALASGARVSLLDKQELAQTLGCSASHVDALRKKGLPTVTVSPKVVRFEADKCIAWLAEQQPCNDI